MAGGPGIKELLDLLRSGMHPSNVAALANRAAPAVGPVGASLSVGPPVAAMAVQGGRALDARSDAQEFARANDPSRFTARSEQKAREIGARSPRPMLAGATAFGNERLGSDPSLYKTERSYSAPDNWMESEPPGGGGYTVRAGDTLYAIARGLMPEASHAEVMGFAEQLQKDLNLSDPRKLQIGTNIPGVPSGTKPSRPMPKKKQNDTDLLPYRSEPAPMAWMRKLDRAEG